MYNSNVDSDGNDRRPPKNVYKLTRKRLALTGRFRMGEMMKGSGYTSHRGRSFTWAAAPLC